MNITSEEFSDVMSINPWRSAIWEAIHSCSVRGRFSKRFAKECTPDMSADSKMWERISKETYSVLLMKAIAATTKGLRQFISSRCSQFEACKKVMDRTEFTVKEIYEKVISVEMSNRLEDIFMSSEFGRPFDDDGKGNVGYEFYSLWDDQYLKISTIHPGVTKDVVFKPEYPTFKMDGESVSGITSLSDACQTPSKLGYVGFLAALVLVIPAVLLFRRWRMRRRRRDGELTGFIS